MAWSGSVCFLLGSGSEVDCLTTTSVGTFEMGKGDGGISARLIREALGVGRRCEVNGEAGFCNGVSGDKPCGIGVGDGGRRIWV